MNIKSVALSLACAAGIVGAASAAALNDVRTDVIPGEWTSSFATAKSYAEANKVPLLMFWSNIGCGQCNKMKVACNNADFVTWRKTRKLIFVFSENDLSSKSFAANSSRKFPYMRLYWPAGNVDVKFTGRASTIPASGSTLQAQLMNYVDANIKAWINGGGDPGSGTSPGGGGTPEPIPEPSVPTPGAEWKKSRVLYGSYYTSEGLVAGRVVLKTGRINTKGIVKIKATLMDVYGKTKSSAQKSFTADATTKGTISGAFGSCAFSITGSAISGTVSSGGVSYELKPLATGGTMDNGLLTFELLEQPTVCQGYPVIEVGGETLLPVGQEFSTISSRWKFPNRGSLRYDRKAGSFTMSSTANPSGLKLSYKTVTGFFKGSFTVFAKRTDTMAKRYTATVTGFMVGGSGAGLAVIKNVGTFKCTIKDEATIAAEEEAARKAAEEEAERQAEGGDGEESTPQADEDESTPQDGEGSGGDAQGDDSGSES